MREYYLLEMQESYPTIDLSKILAEGIIILGVEALGTICVVMSPDRNPDNCTLQMLIGSEPGYVNLIPTSLPLSPDNVASDSVLPMPDPGVLLLQDDGFPDWLDEDEDSWGLPSEQDWDGTPIWMGEGHDLDTVALADVPPYLETEPTHWFWVLEFGDGSAIKDLFETALQLSGAMKVTVSGDGSLVPEQ